MPTYAYACTACQHRFEIVQRFSDDSLTDCPECQGRLRKLFNAVGVVFKGSGFYRNDSRSDRGKVSASGSGARKGSSSGSASSGESSSSASDSSSSTSASTSRDSSTGSGNTKTATKTAPKPSSRSEGSAA